VRDRICDSPGGRLPFPRAADVAFQMEQDRLDAAEGFLQDICFVKCKIRRLKDLLEGLLD
jgi:hypothetical protein